MRTGIWDSFNDTLYIMEGSIDSTLWHEIEHPEWIDDPDIGMLSFSLPQFNIPHAAKTIMDQFETEINLNQVFEFSNQYFKDIKLKNRILKIN